MTDELLEALKQWRYFRERLFSGSRASNWKPRALIS